MIGNELDRVYGDNLDDLFSLMNSMMRIKGRLGATVPITAPLSSTNFGVILKAYQLLRYPLLSPPHLLLLLSLQEWENSILNLCGCEQNPPPPPFIYITSLK